MTLLNIPETASKGYIILAGVLQGGVVYCSLSPGLAAPPAGLGFPGSTGSLLVSAGEGAVSGAGNALQV